MTIDGAKLAPRADDVDLPTGQWVRLLENEEQLNQWTVKGQRPTMEAGTLTVVGKGQENPE